MGFEPPLASGPVTVKKNKALPLKAVLVDEAASPVTDLDLITSPVVQVLFVPGAGGDPIDVTDQAFPAGQGTDGNLFVFSDGKWRFNLKTKNYAALGTYLMSMVSGDPSEYEIDPTCESEFVID